MNCRVCTAPANGFHYKTPSCRACAAFYKRSSQLKLNYTCAFNGDCTAAEGNRFNCRYCRFKRCVEVGMTLDETDTCPDIHLDPVKASTSFLPRFDHDFFAIENIIGNHVNFIETLKRKMCEALNKKHSSGKQIWDTFIIAQADLAYSHHSQRWPCSKETLVYGANVDMTQQMVHFYKELLILAELCSEIKAFAELPLDQKVVLYKNYFVRFCQLDRAAVSLELLGEDPNDYRLLTLSGQVWAYEQSRVNCCASVTDYSADQFKDMILQKEFRYIKDFSKPFKMLKPERFEVLYLMMNCLWDVRAIKEGVTEETRQLSQTILEKLVDELQFYYRHEKKLENTASRIYKLHNLLIILDRIAQERIQVGEMSKVFDIFKMDIHFCKFEQAAETRKDEGCSPDMF